MARQSGGRFVLRIEDTDTARNKPEWTEGILSALAAIGIHGDDPAFEGPYFQSENAARHSEAAQQLHAAGRAYYCDCTPERLKERTGSDSRCSSPWRCSAGIASWPAWTPPPTV